MSECETCGHDIDDENRSFECACGEEICGKCADEHNEGCSEYVASENDKWGLTPAGSLL